MDRGDGGPGAGAGACQSGCRAGRDQSQNQKGQEATVITNMDRRQFLSRTLAGSLSLLASPYLANRALADETTNSFDIKSLFESKDPEVSAAGRGCLPAMRAGQDQAAGRNPETPLAEVGHGRRPSTASGSGTRCSWWICWRCCPTRTALIRDVFQNYWDFQERWNAKRPDYAHDMIPCMIEPRNTADLARVSGLLADSHSGLGPGAGVSAQRRQGTAPAVSRPAGEVPRMVLARARRDQCRSGGGRRLQRRRPARPL